VLAIERVLPEGSAAHREESCPYHPVEGSLGMRGKLLASGGVASGGQRRPALAYKQGG